MEKHITNKLCYMHICATVLEMAFLRQAEAVVGWRRQPLAFRWKLRAASSEVCGALRTPRGVHVMCWPLRQLCSHCLPRHSDTIYQDGAGLSDARLSL